MSLIHPGSVMQQLLIMQVSVHIHVNTWMVSQSIQTVQCLNDFSNNYTSRYFW